MAGRIGNRVTEKDLRDYLDSAGYFGRSAKVHELELAAIEPPGWKQTFRCHFEAKTDPGDDDVVGRWQELFGVIEDDEREGFSVQLFDTAEEQATRLREIGGILKQPGVSPAGRIGLVAVIVALIVGVVAVIRGPS